MQNNQKNQTVAKKNRKSPILDIAPYTNILPFSFKIQLSKLMVKVQDKQLQLTQSYFFKTYIMKFPIILIITQSYFSRCNDGIFPPSDL